MAGKHSYKELATSEVGEGGSTRQVVDEEIMKIVRASEEFIWDKRNLFFEKELLPVEHSDQETNDTRYVAYVMDGELKRFKFEKLLLSFCVQISERE